MMVFKGSPLGELLRIRDVRTCRESSWDCSGGNDDFLVIQAGETASLANILAAGCINLLWCTHWNPQSDALRRLVMRMRWDNEEAPWVEVPLGDFFGVVLARMVSFTFLPLQMSPADGRAFNCWFPMPFDTRTEIELVNESDEKANFYYYVDYEMRHDIPEDFGRFHAQWHRETPVMAFPKKAFLMRNSPQLD